MSDSNKDSLVERVSNLQEGGMTNMIPALQAGIDMIVDNRVDGRISVILFFTDGVPTEDSTYIEYFLNRKLEKLMKNGVRIPQIHTFGFGYDLNSQLLSRISKLTNASYSFISDAGMLATNFNNKIANILTYSNDEIKIEIEIPDSIKDKINFNSYLNYNQNDNKIILFGEIVILIIKKILFLILVTIILVIMKLNY